MKRAWPLLLAACCSLAAAGPVVRDPGALEAAIADSDKPVVLEFYADWCATCKDVERTLREPQVAARLQCATLIRVDLTALAQDLQGKGPARVIAKRFRVSEFPTLVFMDSERQERPGARLAGNPPPPALLASLAAVC